MHVTKAYPQAHDLMYFFHDENRLEFYVIYELSNHFLQPFRRGPLPPPLCITESLQRPYRTESDSGAQCQPNATSEVRSCIQS